MQAERAVVYHFTILFSQRPLLAQQSPCVSRFPLCQRGTEGDFPRVIDGVYGRGIVACQKCPGR